MWGRIVGKPIKTGTLGDIEFDGAITWVCLGGTDWVSSLPVEGEALIRQKSLHDLDGEQP